MKLRVLTVLGVSLLMITTAYAQSDFKAKLQGFQEAPAVVSAGSGTAHITISDDGTSIKYELTYSGLEGSTVPGGKVLFAHIHVGQRNVSGGVAVFFCGGGKTPVTQAACPASATGNNAITGTWTAADIVGPTAQGVDPTDPNGENAFARFIKAIRAGRS